MLEAVENILQPLIAKKKLEEASLNAVESENTTVESADAVSAPATVPESAEPKESGVEATNAAVTELKEAATSSSGMFHLVKLISPFSKTSDAFGCEHPRAQTGEPGSHQSPGRTQGHHQGVCFRLDQQ